MKKAAIELSVEAIIAIVIFFIFAFVAAPKAAVLLGIKSQQDDNFQKFLTTIDEVNNNLNKGGGKSILVNLNDDAALLGFAKGADKMTLYCGTNSPTCSGIKDFHIGAERLSGTGFSYEKPAACSLDQSCFCICKKNFQPTQSKDFCDSKELVCSNKDIDILGLVSGQDFLQNDKGGVFINGFLIAKKTFTYPTYQQTSYSITVQKAKTGTVALCLRTDSNCLAEYEPRVKDSCAKLDAQDSCRANPDCNWSKDVCEPKFV